MNRNGIPRIRNPSANGMQKAYLIDHLEKHREMVTKKFTSSFTYADLKSQWDRLAKELNKIGPPKTADGWIKYFNDQRSGTKRKAGWEVKSRKKTGGGAQVDYKLSPKKARILALSGGRTAVEGNIGVKEFGPLVAKNVVYLDSIKVPPPTNQGDEEEDVDGDLEEYIVVVDADGDSEVVEAVKNINAVSATSSQSPRPAPAPASTPKSTSSTPHTPSTVPNTSETPSSGGSGTANKKPRNRKRSKELNDDIDQLMEFQKESMKMQERIAAAEEKKADSLLQIGKLLLTAFIDKKK